MPERAWSWRQCQAAELMRINRKLSSEKYTKALSYEDREYCKRWGEALREAGLLD